MPHAEFATYEILRKLERLALTDLKKIREIDDFIQINKIVHGLEKMKWCDQKKILRPEQNITG